MIIGGALAITFLKVAKGMRVGASAFDEEGAKHVNEMHKKARHKNVRLL